MLPEKYTSYHLIKYIRPIWYFHLIPYDKKNFVWIQWGHTLQDEKDLMDFDENYSTLEFSMFDISYQALMKGVVKQVENNIQIEKVKLLPTDIYRFIRKYHKKIWLYLTFIQRLFSLNNPINELIGFWQTRKVKRIDLFETHYKYNDYMDYDSPLIDSNPFITIIIPTYNRYEALHNVLEDIQKQTLTNYEVVIIDQSNPYQEDFYNKFNFKHHVIRQEVAALWRARNNGIKSAKSEYLLFLDDDSRIASNWILEHFKCIDYFHADISSGVSISRIGAKVPENYSFFRWSDQLDTGNVLIKKKVFERCGMFDEQFEKMRMGDGEFGVRAYLNGFKNIANPKASRIHLKSKKGGLRDMGHWDAFRPKNILSPRPIPSVLYLYRKYWGDTPALITLLQTVPFSYCPYQLKSKKSGYLLSIIVCILFFPLVLLQVIISWKRSNRMLKIGGLIEKI